MASGISAHNQRKGYRQLLDHLSVAMGDKMMRLYRGMEKGVKQKGMVCGRNKIVTIHVLEG